MTRSRTAEKCLRMAQRALHALLIITVVVSIPLIRHHKHVSPRVIESTQTTLKPVAVDFRVQRNQTRVIEALSINSTSRTLIAPVQLLAHVLPRADAGDGPRWPRPVRLKLPRSSPKSQDPLA
jgi:hypothetical protein